MAYKQTFNINGPFSKLVLEDLAKFCRASETTFHKDERLTAHLEGRRDVWLRIQNYINLTPDELMKLHHVKGEENGS